MYLLLGLMHLTTTDCAFASPLPSERCSTGEICVEDFLEDLLLVYDVTTGPAVLYDVQYHISLLDSPHPVANLPFVAILQQVAVSLPLNVETRKKRRGHRGRQYRREHSPIQGRPPRVLSAFRAALNFDGYNFDGYTSNENFVVEC